MKLAFLVVLVGLACGPSRHEVALTKLARYQGDKLQMLQLARDVAENKYPETRTDETQLMIQTRPRWYTPGGGASPKLFDPNEDPVLRQVELLDKSLLVGLTVKLLPDGESWIVDVHARVARYNKGTPKLEPVPTDRADIPGWLTGKVDQLAFEIHDALKMYEVKGAH